MKQVPVFLFIFSILIISIAILTYSLVPFVYDERHMADTLLLTNIGWRAYNGATPVIDFGYSYGGATAFFVAAAMYVFGVGVKAVDQAVILQFLVLLLGILVIAYRRLSLIALTCLLLVVAATILTRLPLENTPSLTGISAAHSFSYNRFGSVIVVLLTAFALLPAKTRLMGGMAAVFCGAMMYVLFLTKPTFVVFGPAFFFALAVQSRWKDALLGAAALLTTLVLLDIWGQKLLGSFAYAFASVGDLVTIPSLIKQVVKLLLSQVLAACIVCAILTYCCYSLGRRSFPFGLAALALLAGYLGMTATMGQNAFQQTLPLLVILPVLILEKIKLQGTQESTGLTVVVVAVVLSFSVPHLMNTILAGATAFSRADYGLIGEGPMKNYIMLNRDLLSRLQRSGDSEDLPASYQRVAFNGNDLASGIEYFLLADGLSTLREIEGVETLGIVSGTPGFEFSFALGAPPVLSYPVWPTTTAPELASDRPLGDDVDLVLVSNLNMFEAESARLADVADRVRMKMGEEFRICRDTEFWAIYARRSASLKGCD